MQRIQPYLVMCNTINCQQHTCQAFVANITIMLCRMSSRFSEHTFQMMRAVTRDSTKVSAMQANYIIRNCLISHLLEAQGTGFMPVMESRRGVLDRIHQSVSSVQWSRNVLAHSSCCTCTKSPSMASHSTNQHRQKLAAYHSLSSHQHM